AQIISDSVPAADLTQKMKDTFQVRPTPHHDIYKDLLSLDLKTVVTTNYDEFIEKNFEHYSAGNAAYVVCRQNSNDLLDNLRSPTRAIIKIHGCINSATELVLDRHSYFRAKQENPGFFNILSALFTVNTVLFLGYSIGDPDMQLILEGINSVTKSTNGHYALLPKFEHKSLDSVIKKSYNIDIIEYPAGSHSDVPKKINQLSTRVVEFRRERGIV
ncbi:SIR2 family protein, partial [Azotobacter chroococcum]|nr:SIR2 family protein [Azotobacter chroococcum]